MNNATIKITKKTAGFYIAKDTALNLEYWIQSPERTETGFWVITDVTNSFGCAGRSPVFCKTLKECKEHLYSYYLS